MLEKIKLSFIEDINIGTTYILKNIAYQVDGENHFIDLDIYWKNQQVYIDVRLNSQLYIDIVFNRFGVLEYGFAYKDILVLSNIQNIVNLLNNNFNKLSFNTCKTQNTEMNEKVILPYVFHHDNIDPYNIYYNETYIQIPDLDMSELFKGSIIRKNKSLYYVVSNKDNEVLCLLKMKSKDDIWYIVDAKFKNIVFEPSFIVNCFFIPVDGKPLLDEDLHLPPNVLLDKIYSLNIFNT